MRISSKEQLGEVVRDRRKHLTMSQADLALKTGGVSRQWVVELEAGRSNPDFLTLTRLANALQLEFDLRLRDEATLSVGPVDLDNVLRRIKDHE